MQVEEKIRVGYYPGCAITKGSSSEEYGTSVLRVAQEIGPEIEEIRDWNCCGASSAHATNHKLSTALSIRNISIAEQDGIKDILAPCPMCSQRLIISQKDVQDDEKLKKEVEDAIEMPCNGGVKVSNYLEIIKNYCMDKLASKLKKTPKDLKIASYYGCLLVRPPKVLKFDDPEDPKSMDVIVKVIGATPVDWEFKTNCCGGGFTLSKPSVVLKLTNDILEGAMERGADAIVVACPMCHANLDMRQKDIEKEYNRKYNIPVIYISQLIGLALGINYKQLGLKKHFVKTKSVIDAFS